MPRVGGRQTLDVLRRSILNIFWIRDTSTVKGILGYTKEILRKSREGGRLVPLQKINPWTVGYKLGMGMDIQIL